MPEVEVTNGLVFLGRIIERKPIPEADRIISVTVICGKGGKWRGVVRKEDFPEDNNICLVYLPDAVIPKTPGMEFMAHTNWRVVMRKFKGAPSEVLITPVTESGLYKIGDDLTEKMCVKKYIKSIPVHMAGELYGDFPTYIPKTDEPHYQKIEEKVNKLIESPFYITQKMDGSSTTAYRYNNHFGVCSRNNEWKETPENVFWRLCNKHELKYRLPDGYAIQWETCGPGIQKNTAGLEELQAFAFSVYNIERREYLSFPELVFFCQSLKIPMAPVLCMGDSFSMKHAEALVEGKYPNGHPHEGIVVRSQYPIEFEQISFKMINLNYE